MVDEADSILIDEARTPLIISPTQSITHHPPITPYHPLSPPLTYHLSFFL